MFYLLNDITFLASVGLAAQVATVCGCVDTHTYHIKRAKRQEYELHFTHPG